MADEKRLRELLNEERGSHWRELAREYRRLARMFEAKAVDADRAARSYEMTTKD